MARFPFASILILGLAAAIDICQNELDPASDTCLDEASSFLQHSKRRTKAALTGSATKAIQPAEPAGFDNMTLHERHKVLFVDGDDHDPNDEYNKVRAFNCQMFHRPLQLLEMENGNGYAVKELNISTGVYRELFEIPYDRVPGNFTKLNGCGISPMDSKMYCALFANGSFIVRFDDENMEFVARIPYHRYTAAAFAPSGNFYVATYYAGIIVAKMLHNAKGFPFSERKSADIIDLRMRKRLRPRGFVRAADLVVLDANFEGIGQHEYTFILFGAMLQIGRYDTKEENFTRSWNISVKPYYWGNIHGAAWEFQQKIYFAVNRGTGVFEVPYENLGLAAMENMSATGDQRELRLQLENIGQSDPSDHNDGMNCMDYPSPWITNVRPFPCKENPGLVQSLMRDGSYEIAFINATTGNYSTIYKIPYNITDPPYKKMNAFAIGPTDSIAYACIVFDRFDMAEYPTPPPFYIVRFDEDQIEFVAKVQAPFGQPQAGTFDADGNFYVVSNPSLLKFPGIENMVGYTSHLDDALPFLDASNDESFIVKADLVGALQITDIVAMTSNFDGEGRATWVVGVNAYQQIVTVKTDGVGAGNHFVLLYNDVIKSANRQNFGAMWNFGGEVFVSSNDGYGIFQVPVDQIQIPWNSTERFNLTKVGNSDPSSNNDGMNCMRTYSPFGSKAGQHAPLFGSRMLRRNSQSNLWVDAK